VGAVADAGLRWGTRRDRLVLGLALILGGGLGLQGADPYILWLLLAGTLMHAGGWAILPSEGWRRVVAGIVSSAVIWLLLTGPQSLWLLAASFAGWLLVRRRPPWAWVTVALPLASGVVLANVFREYTGMPWALGIQIAVVIGSAWLASLFAQGTLRQARGTGPPRPPGA
jgi:hypothetical protein